MPKIQHHQAAIVNVLREQVPDLLAIYAFSSRIQGIENENSDLDLAVFVAGYADPIKLWEMSGQNDDVLVNKAATIERSVSRAREEYNANP